MLNTRKIFSFLALIALIANSSVAQSDTLNQKDESGKKTGYWIITGSMSPEKGYSAESKIEEGRYKRSRKQGQWVKYHKNGQIRSKIIFINGRSSGEYETYFDNGQLEEKGNFKGGRYTGDYEMYYPNGQIRQKKTFNAEGGTEGTVTYYYPNGQKELEFETKNGVENGPATWYYENGDKKKEQSFQNGVSDGPPKEYARKNPKYKDPSEKKAKKGPKMAGKLNGNKKLQDCYGKTYDDNKNILMDGCFKDGYLYDGRHYIYDEFGLLDRIDIYKEGEFAGNGVIGG